jgi:hypothetical protein
VSTSEICALFRDECATVCNDLQFLKTDRYCGKNNKVVYIIIVVAVL